MASAKIKIYKKQYQIINARREETEPELHHNPWCDIKSLYGQELYSALDIRLENTIVFEVRYCKKVKEMQQHLKEYYIEFEGEKYDIYATDFIRNERKYVQLKANRTE